MSVLATAHDFEGVDWTSMYKPAYRRYPYFALRARHINKMYPTGSILIVGCGYGHLVDELYQRQRDVYGCDLSDYAIRRSHELLPHLGGRIFKADARNHRSFNRTFDVAITEDLLTVCDSLGEAVQIGNALGKVASQVAHIVTTEWGGDTDPRVLQVPDVAWQQVMGRVLNNRMETI